MHRVRRGNPYIKSDAIILCSASYGICYGSPLSEWPQDQLYDRSALHCSENTGPYGMPDDAWSTIRPWTAGLGGYLYQMVRELRGRGLNPAIIHSGYGGQHSDFFYTQRVTLTSWQLARMNQLTLPTIRAIVIDNGTTDAQTGPGTQNWLQNWTGMLVYIRAALVGTYPLIATVKSVVLGMPTDYTGGSVPYAATVAGYKTTLVANEIAAGRPSQYVDVGGGYTYVDSWHPNYAGSKRFGQLIAAAIP